MFMNVNLIILIPHLHHLLHLLTIPLPLVPGYLRMVDQIPSVLFIVYIFKDLDEFDKNKGSTYTY